VVSSVRLPLSPVVAQVQVDPPIIRKMPDACLAPCARGTVYRTAIPWPMMPVRRLPVAVRAPSVLTRPRALVPAAFQRHHFTPSHVSLLLLPTSLISSLDPTLCRVPTRLHPSPRRGTLESLTTAPRPDPFRPRTRTIDLLSHIRLHLRSRPIPSVCSVAPPRPVTLCAD
jgi:hypothetical protein